MFVVKSSGLTPAELVPVEMNEERVKSLDATGSGPNYRQNLQLKPTDELIDRPLADVTLYESMSALEPLKDRLAIVQGLPGKMCRGGHSSWFGATWCYRTGAEHNSGRIIGPTLDGLLPTHLPSIFPHIGLSTRGKVMVGTSVQDGVFYPGISAWAKNRQSPYQATPLTAYKELFSVVATNEDDLVANRLNGTHDRQRAHVAGSRCRSGVRHVRATGPEPRRSVTTRHVERTGMSRRMPEH